MKKAQQMTTACTARIKQQNTVRVLYVCQHTLAFAIMFLCHVRTVVVKIKLFIQRP